MDTPHVRKWDVEAPAALCTGRERGRQIVGCRELRTTCTSPLDFALVWLTAAPRTIRASEALLKKRVARTPTNRLCVGRRPTTITMLSAREHHHGHDHKKKMPRPGTSRGDQVQQKPHHGPESCWKYEQHERHHQRPNLGRSVGHPGASVIS